MDIEKSTLISYAFFAGIALLCFALSAKLAERLKDTSLDDVPPVSFNLEYSEPVSLFEYVPSTYSAMTESPSGEPIVVNTNVVIRDNKFYRVSNQTLESIAIPRLQIITSPPQPVEEPADQP